MFGIGSLGKDDFGAGIGQARNTATLAPTTTPSPVVSSLKVTLATLAQSSANSASLVVRRATEQLFATCTPALQITRALGRTITKSGGGTFNRAKLKKMSGLQAWYEADQLPGANGASISTFPDSTSNGFDATLSSGTAPLLETNVQNGLSILRFNGFAASAKMNIDGSLLSGATQGTCFLVVKAFTDSPGDERDSAAVLQSFTADNTNSSTSHYPYTSGTVYDGFGTNTRKTIGNPSFALTAFRIYQVESQSGSYIVRWDGTTFFTTGTNTAGFGPAAGTNGNRGLGYVSNSNVLLHDYFKGDIGEIIIFNRILQTFERQQVEGYLAEKWALTSNLDPTHPYAGGGEIYGGVEFDLFKAISKTMPTASTTPTAILNKLIPEAVSIAADATAALSRTVGKILSLSADASAIVLPAPQKVIAAAISLATNITRSTIRAIESDQTPAASVLRSTAKMLAATASTAQSLVTSVLVVLSLPAEVTASIFRSAAKIISLSADALASMIEDYIAGSTTYDQTVGATTTPAVSILRQTAHILVALAEGDATVLAAVRHTLALALDATASLFEQLALAITATAEGVASHSAQIEKGLAATSDPAASITRSTARLIESDQTPTPLLAAGRLYRRTVEISADVGAEIVRMTRIAITAFADSVSLIQRAISKSQTAISSAAARISRAFTLTSSGSAAAGAEVSIIRTSQMFVAAVANAIASLINNKIIRSIFRTYNTGPEVRIYDVSAEGRSFDIAASDRTFTVPTQDRAALSVPSQDRTYDLGADERVADVE